MDKQAFTVIGRCVSPAGKETAFVLNNVPAWPARSAARSAAWKQEASDLLELLRDAQP